MKRGILFTIVFSLIFLGFLSLVIISADFVSSGERSFILARRTLRTGTLADNAGRNLAEISGLSVSASRAPTNLTLTFSDFFPSNYSSGSAEITNYKSFFENKFATKLNLNTTLDVSELQANPYVYSNGSALNYSYSSWQKGALLVSAGPALVAYSLKIRFSGNDAMNDTYWAWSSCSLPCAGTDIEIRLNISNYTGPAPLQVSGCTAGCVSRGGTGVFSINSSSPAPLTFSRNGANINLTFSPTSAASSVISVTSNYTNATTVYFPVRLSIANLSGMNSTVPFLPILRV
jgi:hypothetical protein